MTRAGNSFQTDASPVRADRAGSEGASSRVMASRAARLGSQMGASTVGLPRGRLYLIWCGRRPKAACGRGCSPVEAYIALASPRSRAARRDSGRARLPRLPEAKFIRFYYLRGPRERLDERAPAGAAAGPQLSDQGLCGAPVSFWQVIAWCGRVSRARSARPFTATLPSTPHYHTRRLTSFYDAHLLLQLGDVLYSLLFRKPSAECVPRCLCRNVEIV